MYSNIFSHFNVLQAVKYFLSLLLLKAIHHYTLINTQFKCRTCGQEPSPVSGLYHIGVQGANSHSGRGRVNRVCICIRSRNRADRHAPVSQRPRALIHSKGWMFPKCMRDETCFFPLKIKLKASWILVSWKSLPLECVTAFYLPSKESACWVSIRVGDLGCLFTEGKSKAITHVERHRSIHEIFNINIYNSTWFRNYYPSYNLQ